MRGKGLDECWRRIIHDTPFTINMHDQHLCMPYYAHASMVLYMTIYCRLSEDAHTHPSLTQAPSVAVASDVQPLCSQGARNAAR